MKKNIKFIISITVLIILFMSLVACNNKDNQQSFTVAFDSNGGEELENINTTFIEERPLINKEGYFFDTWYIDKECTIQAGFPLHITEDTMLYANWITMQSGSPFLDYKYDTNTDSYTVISYNGNSNNVIIPQTYDEKDVTKIGYGAFYFCDSVQEIFLPDSIVHIDSPFDRCENLSNIFVDNNNQMFESVDGVLYNKNKSILISYPPAKKEEILVVFDSVEEVARSAIRFCKHLKHIELSRNTTSIFGFFEGCVSLTGINVDNENQVYMSNNGVLYTKDMNCLIFYPQNHPQTHFDIPIGVQRINDYAFSESKVQTISIPASIQEVSLFEKCNSLEAINVSDDNQSYSSIDGVLFSKVQDILLQYPVAKQGKVYNLENNNSTYQYQVPDGVKKISSWAFNSCLKLNKVIIPSTVTEIAEYAFTNLENLFELYEIECASGSQLSSIGENAFMYCPLTVLVFTSTVPPVTSGYSKALIGVDDNFKIIVPENMYELYEDSIWSYYKLKVGPDVQLYNIKFDTNDGEAIQTKKYAYIDEEIMPQREGYIFGGWFDNNSLDGKRIGFPLAIDRDMTLFAKWYSTEKGTAGLEYRLLSTSNTYAISGYNGNDDIINIPTVYEDIPVTEIANNAFQGKTFIQQIILPETIERIGDYAFAGSSDKLMFMQDINFHKNIKLQAIGKSAFQYCVLLKNIELPSSLKSIDNGAFNNCKSITKISLPQQIEVIGGYVFSDCDGLERIEIDSSNEYYASRDGVLYNNNQTVLIKYPAGNEKRTFTIPDRVEIIDTEAFYASYNLEEVIFSKNLITIRERAFRYCYQILEVILPESLTVFNPSIFRNSGIRKITLPANLVELQDLFNGLDYLQDIYIDDSNANFTAIDGILYSKSIKTLIRCPIGKQSYVSLPETVRYIGEGAFRECRIESIELSKNLEKINKEAFYKCSVMTSIELNKKLKEIGDYAFAYANNLRHIVLSSQDDYPILGDNVFAETNYGRGIIAYVPTAIIGDLIESDWLSKDQLKPNTVIINNMELEERDDSSYKLVRYLSSDKQIIVPSKCNNKEIREIGSYAFSERTRKIILPETIQLVNNQALSSSLNSQLTTVIFEGDGELTISPNAFNFCDILSTIIFYPIVNMEGEINLQSTVDIYVPNTAIYLESPLNQYDLKEIVGKTDDYLYSYLEEETGIVIDAYIGYSSIINMPQQINKSGDVLDVLAVSAYAINPTVEKVTVSSSIKYIYDNAFSLEKYNKGFEFSQLKEIQIKGNNLLSIGENVFFGTSISCISIPNSTKHIGDTAFNNCYNLQEIIVTEENEHYSSDNGVLYDKGKEKLICYPSGKKNIQYLANEATRTVTKYAFANAENLVQVSFSNELYYIEDFAFMGCLSLLYVDLQEGVRSVGDYAFTDCHRLINII